MGVELEGKSHRMGKKKKALGDDFQQKLVKIRTLSSCF